MSKIKNGVTYAYTRLYDTAFPKIKLLHVKRDDDSDCVGMIVFICLVVLFCGALFLLAG